MSDLYSELLVKKEPTAKDSIVKYGMIVLTVLAVGAGLFIMFGMDSDFVCRNFVLWCGIYVTDHWTKWA